MSIFKKKIALAPLMVALVLALVFTACASDSDVSAENETNVSDPASDSTNAEANANVNDNDDSISSNQSSDQTTLSGIASKGPIKNGTVSVYKLNVDGSRGERLASSNTNSDGSYQLEIAYQGALEVCVQGGSYQDEATGEQVELSEQNELKTMVAQVSGNESIAVTPLTTMAAERARVQAHQGLETAIAASNKEVANAFGLGDLDISKQKPSDLTKTDSAGDDEQAKKYGLALAGLSQAIKDGAKEPKETLALIEAMVEDFSDGQLDGQKSGQQLQNVSPIATQEMAQKMIQAKENFMNGAQNSSGFKPSVTAPPVSQSAQSDPETQPQAGAAN